MRSRLQTLGAVLALIGLMFVVGAGVAYSRVQDGYDSLQTFSAAQNVNLSYNDDGQLVDRGETAGADAIMTLLADDWGYPVVKGDLNPNDPLVNTATEYMFQMATIVYHTTSGAVTVTLTEPAETADGETLAAGDYEVAIDGRYWTEFDRTNPLDGAARELAWSGTVHGLVGELGVGTVTHSALQMGLGIAAILLGLGGTLILAGAGLIWTSRADDDDVTDEAVTPTTVREEQYV